MLLRMRARPLWACRISPVAAMCWKPGGRAEPSRARWHGTNLAPWTFSVNRTRITSLMKSMTMKRVLNFTGAALLCGFVGAFAQTGQYLPANIASTPAALEAHQIQGEY